MSLLSRTPKRTDLKHRDYGFILALVCMWLALLAPASAMPARFSSPNIASSILLDVGEFRLQRPESRDNRPNRPPSAADRPARLDAVRPPHVDDSKALLDAYDNDTRTNHDAPQNLWAKEPNQPLEVKKDRTKTKQYDFRTKKTLPPCDNTALDPCD